MVRSFSIIFYIFFIFIFISAFVNIFIHGISQKKDFNSNDDKNEINEDKDDIILDEENNESYNNDGIEISLVDFQLMSFINDDVNSFINKLNRVSGIKRTKNGFPEISLKPASLKENVWKQYLRELKINK